MRVHFRDALEKLRLVLRKVHVLPVLAFTLQDFIESQVKKNDIGRSRRLNCFGKKPGIKCLASLEATRRRHDRES